VKVNGRALAVLLIVTAVVAVLRFFMKGWLEPLGVSDKAGSFVASITVVVLVGLVVLFVREGRAAAGSYWRGVGCFAALALWSQVLIFAGILIQARTGTPTYYEEMMGKHLGMPPLQHAISHLIVAVPEMIVGAILGGLIYWAAKRSRPSGGVAAAQ
jgi:hypothetical protein